MDSGAALALATSPPTSELLKRPPDARDAPLITFDMWKMILSQAVFQIVVELVLLQVGGGWMGLDNRDQVKTFVFNTYVHIYEAETPGSFRRCTALWPLILPLFVAIIRFV